MSRWEAPYNKCAPYNVCEYGTYVQTLLSQDTFYGLCAQIYWWLWKQEVNNYVLSWLSPYFKWDGNTSHQIKIRIRLCELIF